MRVFFMIVVVSCFLAACQKKGNSNSSAIENVDKKVEDEEKKPAVDEGILADQLDLKKFNGLALVKSQSASLTSKDPEGTKDLMGVSEDGVKEPISLAKNGARSNIVAVIPVGGEYVYLILSYHEVNIKTESGDFCPIVILRKVDGKLFCVPNVRLSLSHILVQNFTDRIQSNAAHDLHFFEGEPYDSPTFSGYPYIYTVDFRKGDLPTVKVAYNKVGYASGTKVNSRGDLFFSFYEEIGGSQLRINRADGGFQPAGWGPYISCPIAGLGTTANDFYFFGGIAGNSNLIGKFSENPDGIFKDTIIHADENGAVAGSGTSSFQCAASVSAGEIIYWVGEGTHDLENKGFIIEQNIKTNNLIRSEIPGLTLVADVKLVNDVIYMMGLNAKMNVTIISMSTKTGQFTELYSGDRTYSDYDFQNEMYSMGIQGAQVTLYYYDRSDNEYKIIVVNDAASKIITEGMENYIPLK